MQINIQNSCCPSKWLVLKSVDRIYNSVAERLY